MAYELTFGQVVDGLQEGQVAESETKHFIVKRKGFLYYGTDVNSKMIIAPCYTDEKWRTTEVFEDRVCGCGNCACGALLKPGTEAYADGKITKDHLRNYYLESNV
jgi:hypothetical protein